MGEFFKPWRQKDRRGDAGDCVRVYGGMDSKSQHRGYGPGGA